jgi:hypothetical protein
MGETHQFLMVGGCCHVGKRCVIFLVHNHASYVISEVSNDTRRKKMR